MESADLLRASLTTAMEPLKALFEKLLKALLRSAKLAECCALVDDQGSAQELLKAPPRSSTLSIVLRSCYIRPRREPKIG